MIRKIMLAAAATVLVFTVGALAHPPPEGPDGLNAPHCVHMTVEQAVEAVQIINSDEALSEAFAYVDNHDGPFEWIEYTIEWKVSEVAPRDLGGIGKPICLI